MDTSEKKVAQYLEEALATERALVRVLQSQILMTPRGSYRSALETHLRETKSHADRVSARLDALGRASNPVQTVVGFAETVVGQALALGKTPIDLLRGTGHAEKVLKNAKDACATEALEIGTYTAIERLARAVGDGETAELAASILADEERMLQAVRREIPKLAEAVVGAEVEDEADPVIPRYDALTAGEVVSRLAELSQADLGRVEAYERANQNRATVLERVAALRVAEPWPGYDALTAAQVRAALAEADGERVDRVRAYERAHKNRAAVLRAADREPSTA